MDYMFSFIDLGEVENYNINVHNVRSIKCISYTRLKKLKKVKNCNIKKVSNQTFSAVCHNQHMMMMANSRKRLV